VKLFLREYQEPPLAADRREELEAFVERRAAEGGVPVDY
jgi:trimethylamine:corrinoid methyltransferase-like protein